MSARAIVAAVVCLGAVAASGAGRRLAAQAGGTSADSTVASTERRVEGRVVRPRPGDEEPRPIAGVMVTLHRVGADSAGAIDSMRTRGDGRYAFRYRPWGRTDALYLVSVDHAGIGYFGTPLHDVAVTGDEAEIVVYDTTSSPVPITVRARHLIVSAPVEGEREIVEVYELSNDTLLTAVPGPSERAVWTAIVPEHARDLTVPGEQGIAAGAVQLRDGRVLVFAPFTPGIRQLAWVYRLPASVFPLSVPTERATGSLEVLLQEPTASATAPGMTEVEPTSVEGRTFRRFVARDVPANAVVTVVLPPPPPSRRALWVALTITAIGVVMLMALARAMMRGGPRPARGRSAVPVPSERLRRQIDALDAAFARHPAPTDEAREAYEAQRRAMASELEAALDREGGRK